MTSNIYDEAIQEIWHAVIDTTKEFFETMDGVDYGDTHNQMDYYNYLADNPIVFTYPDSSYDFGDPGTGGFIGGDPTESGLSQGMFNYIYQIESGYSYGKPLPQNLLNGKDIGDAGGHKTYGAGLLFHPSGKYMDQIKPIWSQSELDGLFIGTVKSNVDKVHKWMQKNNIALNQNQIDAIVSGIYNFGAGFLNKSVCKMIAKDPNDRAIHNTWAHMSDVQGKKYPGLIKRRNLEANWYFGQFA